MSSVRVRLESRHWFGKASAGLILGFGLAVAVSGLFAWLGPGGIDAGGGKNQFNMWLVAPIWAAVLSLVFMLRDGRSAWCWLGLSNAVALGLLGATRLMLG